MKLKNLAITCVGIACTLMSHSTISQIRDVSNNMLFQISGDEVMRLQDDYVVDVSGAVKLQNSTLTCNAGNEGAFRYNGSDVQVCNGTTWRSLQIAYKNYFVLTKSKWNGNLGGLSGADAKCLTDLTNEDWMGKSTANLSASTVKAFLSSNISHFAANTVYNFAVASSPTIGGETFVTDGSGLGPNNLDRWDDADHFGSTHLYWTGLYGDFAQWSHDPMDAAPDCDGWTDAGMGSAGEEGSSTTGAGFSKVERYYRDMTNVLCVASLRLVCIVNAE